MPPAEGASHGHIDRWDHELKMAIAALVKVEGESARLEVGTAGPRSIRVLSSATSPAEDRQALEAGSTCTATRRGIVCDEAMLSWLPADHGLQVDPALLFLVAHELRHLLDDQRGDFHAPALTIEAGKSHAGTIALVEKKVCAVKDLDEERADDFARGVVGRVTAAGIFSTDLGIGAASALLAMYQVALSLPLGGDPSLAKLLDQMPPEVVPAQVSAVADRLLCAIRPPRPAAVRWVGFPGGYQTTSLRLIRTAARLRVELEDGAYGVLARAGNLVEVLRTWLGVTRVLAEQHERFVAAIAAEVCERVQQEPDPWADLDCDTDPAVFAPASRCPTAEAVLGTSSTVRPGSHPTVGRVVDGTYVANAPVTALALRGNGEIIAAVGDRGALVSWAAPAVPVVLAQVGCTVGGLAVQRPALVAVCARAEAVARLDGDTIVTTPLAAVHHDGEALPRDGVTVVWAGTAGGRVLVSLVLHGSGRGVLTELGPTGLRTLGAWLTGECNSLPAPRVTARGERIWVTPARHEMAPEAIELDGSLDRVLQRLRPDDVRTDRIAATLDFTRDPPSDPRYEVAFASCFVSSDAEALCVDAAGTIVAARDPYGGTVATVPLSAPLSAGTVVQACSTGSADYLAVAPEHEPARVFERRRGATQVRVRWQAPASAASSLGLSLVCGETSAALHLSDGGRSTVVPLRSP